MNALKITSNLCFQRGGIIDVDEKEIVRALLSVAEFNYFKRFVLE